MPLYHYPRFLQKYGREVDLPILSPDQTREFIYFAIASSLVAQTPRDTAAHFPKPDDGDFFTEYFLLLAFRFLLRFASAPQPPHQYPVYRFAIIFIRYG